MSKPGPRPLAAFPVLTEYSDENTSSAYSRAPEKPKGGRKVFGVTSPRRSSKYYIRKIFIVSGKYSVITKAGNLLGYNVSMRQLGGRIKFDLILDTKEYANRSLQ